MFLGVAFVISTLIFAVQQGDNFGDEYQGEDIEIKDKSVSSEYRISAIEIPADLNFANEIVPQEDP